MTTARSFKKLSYSLDAYAGQKIDLRFRYQTDVFVAQKGFVADRITVTAAGSPLFSGNPETADPAWTAAGFSRFGGSYTTEHEQYYIAENRQYVSYDRALTLAINSTGGVKITIVKEAKDGSTVTLRVGPAVK